MKEKGFLLAELFFIVAFLSILVLSILIVFSSTVRKQRENLEQMVAVSIAQSFAVKEKAGLPVKFPVKIKGFNFERIQFRVNGEEIIFIKVRKGEREWKVPVK